MTASVSFAVPDWWERLQRGETPIPALPLDERKARRAVALFNSLRLPDVKGKPTLAEAGADWFRQMLAATFAAEDPVTGRPLVREVMCLVPKKNNKTTGAAALGLTALMLSDRPNAQMSIIGPTKLVAQRCFDQAWGMIKSDKRLADLFHVQDHRKTITRLKTGAVLKVTTMSMDVVTGEIPALTILDELHVMAADRDAGRVIAQIEGGMITDPDAKLITITTQSDVEPQGVFKAKLERARGIRDGTIKSAGGMLPVLYEFPESVQIDPAQPWLDPATWPAVLPNLGLSVQLDLLQELFEKNRQEGKAALRIWASQHLNVQVGLGTQDGRWIAADYWPSAADPTLTLEAFLDRVEVAVAGGDAGGADDLFALALAGRCRETRRVLTWAHAWCLETVLERRKDIAVRLEDLAAAGDLTITPTAFEHVEGFADHCEMIEAAGLFPKERAIGLDPYGIAALMQELIGRGFAEEKLVGVGQGFKLNGAIKGIERRLVDGTLVHGGQPLMDWCIGNAKAELRGNNTMVTKALAGSAKIDPVVALFNAMILMDMNPQLPVSVDYGAFLDNAVLVA